MGAGEAMAQLREEGGPARAGIEGGRIRRRARRNAVLIAATAALAGVAPSRAVEITLSRIATGGSWSDATQWAMPGTGTNGVPNNGGGNTYNAIIAPFDRGASLDIDVTVENLNLVGSIGDFG